MATTQTTIAPAERARREALEQAEHSGEMEGLHVDPATRADGEEYAAGRIDIDEFGARTQDELDRAEGALRMLGAPVVAVGLQVADRRADPRASSWRSARTTPSSDSRSRSQSVTRAR